MPVTLLIRLRFRAPVLLVVALLTLLSPPSFADERIPPLAELFPTDTAVYLGISDTRLLSEKAGRTDFAKLLQMEGIKQFVDQVTARAKSQSTDGVPLMEYLQVLGEGKGKASLAVVEKARSFSAIALVIEVKGDAAKFSDLLRSLKMKIESNGFSSRALAAATPIVAYEKTVPAKRAILQCWFETPQIVCIANDLELAESILAQMPSDAKEESLATNLHFCDSLKNCAEVKSPDIWFYANPSSIAQLAQSDPDDGIEPKQVLEKHGFDQFQAIAATVELARDELDLEYDLFVKAPKPFSKAMRMFQFESSDDLDPPHWLCDDLNNVIRLQWNIKELLTFLGDPIDDVMQQEDFLKGMLDDLKSDIGPGVDLQKELFDYLSPPVLVIGRSDATISASSEHTLVAVKVTDDAKVAAAIRKLLANDPTANREFIPPSLELWKMGSSKPLGGKEAGIRFKSSGIMVLDGYVVMSTNVDGIKRLLESRNAKKPPLAQSAEYLRGKEKFGSSAKEKGIFRVFFSMSRDMQTTYELLRSGKIESAESIYAQLLSPLVLADRKSGKAYEFSKLPEFKNIRHLLGTAFAHGVDTEQGWKLRGIILKNPPAPAAK